MHPDNLSKKAQRSKSR